MRKQSNDTYGKYNKTNVLQISVKLKIILGISIFLSFFLMAAVKHVYATLLFASLALVGAIWVFVSVVINIVEAMASRNWPVVTFSFVGGEVNIKSPSSGGGAHTKYTPIFHLRYEYSGEEYICSNDAIKRIDKRVYYTFQGAQEFLNRLRSGGFAYVCPQNPAVLFMTNGVSLKHFFSVIVSLVTLLMSLLAWIILVNYL